MVSMCNNTLGRKAARVMGAIVMGNGWLSQRALSSFLVYWCVLLCILSYRFVVSSKNVDLDLNWPLSGWGQTVFRFA